MADKSISQLSPGVAVTDTDLLPNVQVVGVGPVKTTAVQIKTYVNTDPNITGVIKAQLGSAAAPSYTFDGDLNTGWWSPAADTLAASTNGSERIRIDNAGNIGVGVNPTGWGGGILRPIQLGFGAAVSGGVSFLDAFLSSNSYFDGTNWRYIAANKSAYLNITGLGEYKFFSTNTPGNAGDVITFTQAMTLTAAGNLGIGTTSPAQRLHVNGLIQAESSLILNASATNIIYFKNGYDFQLSDTIGAVRATVNTSGNWGFGISPPVARVDAYITSGQPNVPSVRFWSNNGGGAVQNNLGLQVYGNLSSGLVDTTIVYGNTALSYLAIGHHNGTTYAERMRITSSGNVTIGETADVFKFSVHVNNPTRGIVAQIRNSGTSSFTGAQLLLTQNGVEDWAIGQPASTSAFAIWSGRNSVADGAERMRITSAGDVGIGTISPAAKLQVTSPNRIFDTHGNLNVYTSDAITVGTGGAIALGGENGTGSTIPYPYAKIQGIKEGATNTWNGALVFGTTAGSSAITERMRIDSAGNVGVGVTPSAWGASSRAIQNGARSSWYTNGANTSIGLNVYNDGAANRYIATAASALYEQSGGVHAWYNAASGTAGNAITFTQAMTLNASGNLGIGSTNPTSRITVEQSSEVSIALVRTSTGFASYIINDGTNHILGSSQGSTGKKVFIHNSAPDSSMTLDASGNLMVGVTSATAGNLPSVTVSGPLSVSGYLGTHQTNKGILEYNANRTSIRSYGATAGSGYISFMTGGGGATTDTEFVRITANGNLGIGTIDQFGSGVKVVGIANATTVPTTNPTDGGVLYVEGGALKYRGSSGTVTTIAAA